MDLEEVKSVQSLIAQRAHELSNGQITSESSARAAQEAADMLYPGMTGKELKQEIFAEFSKLIPKTEVTKNVDTVQVAEDAPRVTFEQLYRAWIDNNNFLPPDSLFVHFGIAPKGTTSRARSVMRKEGYEFELIGNNEGFTITRRPECQKSPEMLLAELANAMKSDSKVRAAALLKELMTTMQQKGKQ